MATWTTIPDSSLEPGKPIRSIDALALRDNPVAISEGASGAPKILDAALGSTVTTAGTDWVLNRTAGASVGAVGTYAFLRPANTTTYTPGSTLAGSSLRYSAGLTAAFVADGEFTRLTSTSDGSAPAGTWLCMGHRQASASSFGPVAVAATLWLRIA